MFRQLAAASKTALALSVASRAYVRVPELASRFPEKTVQDIRLTPQQIADYRTNG
jgi:hypothetical protein